MARQPSQILTAAELKAQKADLKAEVSAHAATAKSAEKGLVHAKKYLAVQNKSIEAAYAKAGKDHVAALKAACKTFESAQKQHLRAIEQATKLGNKAETKVSNLAPKVKAFADSATV